MHRILLVDDSEAVRQRLRDCLTADEFEVVEAIDGIDALECLKKEPGIGLVFLDVNMPRLDGVSMLERMKAEGIFPEIPFVILTTEGQTSLVERAKKAGAKGWLMKPFQPETILKVAHAVLRKKGATAP